MSMYVRDVAYVSIVFRAPAGCTADHPREFAIVVGSRAACQQRIALIRYAAEPLISKIPSGVMLSHTANANRSVHYVFSTMARRTPLLNALQNSA